MPYFLPFSAMVQMHEFWWCRVGGLECRYLAFFFFSRADQLPLSSAQLTFFLHFKSSCLSLFLPQLSSLKVLFLSITFGFITNAHNYHHNERAHAALEHSMLNWSLGGSFVCTQVHAINSTYKLSLALNFCVPWNFPCFFFKIVCFASLKINGKNLENFTGFQNMMQNIRL